MLLVVYCARAQAATLITLRFLNRSYGMGAASARKWPKGDEAIYNRSRAGKRQAKRNEMTGKFCVPVDEQIKSCLLRVRLFQKNAPLDKFEMTHRRPESSNVLLPDTLKCSKPLVPLGGVE